jgi:transposase
LTLKGWTSARIAEVFCVREDTVRFWRGAFARGGVEAVKASMYAGPPPVKTEAALRVCVPLLEAPVADRRNWTIPRLIAEIKRVERIGLRLQLRKAQAQAGDMSERLSLSALSRRESRLR